MTIKMTAEEAMADLQSVARQAQDLTERELAEIAQLAVPMIQQRWPRDTGLSANSFGNVGATIVNPVRYAGEVHNGLYLTLIPEVVAELDPLAVDNIDQAIRRAARWE